MFKRPVTGLLAVLSLGLLAACGGTPYTPVATQADPIDLEAYGPKVDSFVVLLDTSGSMDKDGSAKIHAAQDLVATMNTAVPDIGFNAGMIIFGKGAGSCIGYGVTSNIYGMTKYNAGDFGQALGSIECAGGTTPIVDALNDTTTLLSPEPAEGETPMSYGKTAVIVVSDTKWDDGRGVKDAVDGLVAAHGGDVCLHVVKIGDYTHNDDLVSQIIDKVGCGNVVSGDSIASASAMSAYVADTLMSPITYEKHTLSAAALFDFDKSVVKPEGKQALMDLGKRIREGGMSVVDIDVIGHTDSVGSDEYNMGLSMRRAQAVTDYLVSQGVNGQLIDTSGVGESQPVATNDTEAGRAQNRRVEVHVGTSRRLQ